jgi:hypothetical protein
VAPARQPRELIRGEDIDEINSFWPAGPWSARRPNLGGRCGRLRCRPLSRWVRRTTWRGGYWPSAIRLSRRRSGAPCLWRALLLARRRARLPLNIRQASRGAAAPASFAIAGAGRATAISSFERGARDGPGFHAGRGGGISFDSHSAAGAESPTGLGRGARPPPPRRIPREHSPLRSRAGWRSQGAPLISPFDRAGLSWPRAVSLGSLIAAVRPPHFSRCAREFPLFCPEYGRRGLNGSFRRSAEIIDSGVGSKGDKATRIGEWVGAAPDGISSARLPARSVALGCEPIADKERVCDGKRRSGCRATRAGGLCPAGSGLRPIFSSGADHRPAGAELRRAEACAKAAAR